jgi:hypothetical protein
LHAEVKPRVGLELRCPWCAAPCRRAPREALGVAGLQGLGQAEAHGDRGAGAALHDAQRAQPLVHPLLIDLLRPA